MGGATLDERLHSFSCVSGGEQPRDIGPQSCDGRVVTLLTGQMSGRQYRGNA
jgi:hypothetical protein